MRTPDGVIEWAHDNPVNVGPGGPSWDNDCVAFIRRSGNFAISNTAPTANLARAATLKHGHELEPTHSPPAGWFVWFDGPTKAGHVGMSVGGGKFLSATVHERDPNFGPALGIMTISDYNSIRGVTYKGAGPWFIDQTLNLSSAAGGSATPITELKDDNMFLIKPTTDWSGAPLARILTDLRNTEVVTDTARIALIDFTASRGNGPAMMVFDQTNWVKVAALPVFPTAVGGGYNPSDADVVDEAEMGGALTSTVTLINQHADTNKTAIIDAINGLTLSAS